MSVEAKNFKVNNNLDYKSMSMKQLNDLPLLSGIFNFATSNFNFDLVCIKNDDSSVVRFFWQDEHDMESLDLWEKITKNSGIFIDVGSHTGLFTIVGLLSNPNNLLISIEPSFLNMGRMITNLRLNNLFKRNSRFLGAASNVSGNGLFEIYTDLSFMSKGGKLSSKGDRVNVIKLDDIIINNDDRKIKGIKVDTEGEDYKVLLGAKNIIENFLPKIIIEIREENKIDIQNFLNQFGYKFYFINNLNETINLTEININTSINIFASV